MLQEKSKKNSRRVHLLTSTAFDDAGTALDSLLHEGPVTASPTALAVIQAHIQRILELRAKKIPPRRIYEALRASTKMRISYPAFQTYVSAASLAAGLREGRKPPAVKIDGWACPECRNAVKQRSGNQTFFECLACGTAYAADDAGVITPARFSNI